MQTNINISKALGWKITCSESCSNRKYPLLVLLDPFLLKNTNSCRSRFLYSGSCTPLFLISTPFLLRKIQLRLYSDSESFSNIIFRFHSDLFKLWETNVVTSKSQFTLASFLATILKFDSKHWLHSNSNKLTKKHSNYTPNPTKNAIFHSIPSFAHFWPTGVSDSELSALRRLDCAKGAFAPWPP